MGLTRLFRSEFARFGPIAVSAFRGFLKGSQMNKIVRSGAVALGSVAGAVGPALAAVPTEVTTAMTDMKADALTGAGLVLVAIIAVMAFKFMRKGF
jgi:hypothetical protein